MLTRIATVLPLAPVDALFARVLVALSPRIKGYACVPDCGAPRINGSCNCGNGCYGDTYVDDCTGGFCFCGNCAPHPPC